MIVEKAQREDRKKIFLDSPDGNAFSLLALAKKTAEQLGMDWIEVKRGMTGGNYENLLKTFDKYFGEIFTLVRKEEI